MEKTVKIKGQSREQSVGLERFRDLLNARLAEIGGAPLDPFEVYREYPQVDLFAEQYGEPRRTDDWDNLIATLAVERTMTPFDDARDNHFEDWSDGSR